jgi:hypothetical protein
MTEMAESAEVVKQFYSKETMWLVEMPDKFAVARWPRDADGATIARCILGTLKYEPHTADTTALRNALERIAHSAAHAA